jgi:hypothetical protein
VRSSFGALATGCGGESGEPHELDGTLGYFPADASIVVVVTTDLDGDQLERLDRKIVRPESGGESIEDLMRGLAEELQLSWEDDIKPLLGNPLVAGTQSSVELAGISAALRVPDEQKLRDVVEKIPGATREGEANGADLYEAEAGIALAIEDDFFIVAQDRDTLARALEQKDSDDGLTEAELDESVPASSDPLLRGRTTIGQHRGVLRRLGTSARDRTTVYGPLVRGSSNDRCDCIVRGRRAPRHGCGPEHGRRRSKRG